MAGNRRARGQRRQNTGQPLTEANPVLRSRTHSHEKYIDPKGWVRGPGFNSQICKTYINQQINK
jgi:hypothetical protein